MSLENERMRFYFRNCNQIEEWVALRSEAAGAVHQWLCEIEQDVLNLATELGPDVELENETAEKQPWPFFRLLRPSWRCGRSGPVPVCVTLQWHRTNTTLCGANLPYVALASGKEDLIGAALRHSQEVQAVRKSRKDQTSVYSVGWGRVLLPGAFPETADEYRAALVAALRKAWTDYAHHVDAVVLVVQNGATGPAAAATVGE